MASKYKLKKFKKYNYGGTMYAPNVIGNPTPPNTTSNILFQETDPQLQEARMLGFEDEVRRLTAESETRSDAMEAQQELDEQEVELKGAETDKKFATGEQAVTAGLQTAKTMGWLGQGAKSAASCAGIGAIAGIAGKGISAIADDDDATKWNAGEVTGDLLSAAGTGAAWGSMIPGVGTVVGGIAGLGYGAIKGLVSRKKARQEEERLRQERVKENREDNIDAMENYAMQKSQVRAGELKSKTYSGYDLGRNTMARYGGLKRYI